MDNLRTDVISFLQVRTLSTIVMDLMGVVSSDRVLLESILIGRLREMPPDDIPSVFRQPPPRLVRKLRELRPDILTQALDRIGIYVYASVPPSTRAEILAAVVAYDHDHVTLSPDVQEVYRSYQDQSERMDQSDPYSYLSYDLLELIRRERGLIFNAPRSRSAIVSFLRAYDKERPFFRDQARRPSPQSPSSVILTYLDHQQIDLRDATVPVGQVIIELARQALRCRRYKGLRHVDPRPTRPLHSGFQGLDRAIELAREGFLLEPSDLEASSQGFLPELQDLARYPTSLQLVDILNLWYAREEDLRFMFGLRSNHDPIETFLDATQLRFALMRGWLPRQAAVRAQAYQRYATFGRLPEAIKRILSRMALDLYPSPREGLAILAQENPHPLEPIILTCLDHPAVCAKRVGMIIPPGMDVAQYVQANIDAYAYAVARSDEPRLDLSELVGQPLATRVEKLRNFTDVELLAITGVRVAYRSRIEMITTLARLLTEPGAFLPVILRCQNTHTISYSDVHDPDLSLVALGTLTDYRVYERDDFATFIRSGPLTIFEHPERGRLLDLETVKQLGEVIKTYLPWTNLLRLIEGGLRNAQLEHPDDQEAVTASLTLSESDREGIRSGLHLLFRASMFMRGWDGLGSYPLQAASTIQNGRDPFVLTTVGMNELEDHLDRLSRMARWYIRHLPVVYYRGSLHHDSTKIGWYLDHIRDGTQCIRQASSVLACTAQHYLTLLFDDEISGFTYSEIANIL